MTSATANTPVSHTEIELQSVSFFGRTFEEYTGFFALDVPLLQGKRVLDVAAGPSSFTYEANKQGIDAIAVDPLYGCSPECLEQHVAIDHRTLFAQIRSKPELFRGSRFASIDEAEKSRRTAARRFLVDYGAHFVHNRYVGASLPKLPFADHSFDLVLCAHLLFLYSKFFSFDFHVAACREMVRVARRQVRIHPLVDLGGRPYPHLEALRESLAASGIGSEIVNVENEFFAGTNTMLVLQRA